MHELSVRHLKLPCYEHLQQRTFIVLPVLCLSSPSLLLVLLYSVHEGPPSIFLLSPQDLVSLCGPRAPSIFSCHLSQLSCCSFLFPCDSLLTCKTPFYQDTTPTTLGLIPVLAAATKGRHTQPSKVRTDSCTKEHLKRCNSRCPDPSAKSQTR